MPGEVRRALIPGRFQPPHWGHFRLLEWALERFDEVIVAVGSAQKSHTFTNPFTAGERIEMIRLGLRDAGLPLERVLLVPVPDIEMNHLWPRWVELLTPRFDCVVSGNALVARLFREYGYCVVEPPLFERQLYTATRIRRLMLENGNWEKFVPPSVAAFIKSIDGVGRLREIREV